MDDSDLRFLEELVLETDERFPVDDDADPSGDPPDMPFMFDRCFARISTDGDVDRILAGLSDDELKPRKMRALLDSTAGGGIRHPRGLRYQLAVACLFQLADLDLDAYRMEQYRRRHAIPDAVE
jgi:hypothetical protein